MRLQAFTILELSVILILSALVVSMAYLGLQVVTGMVRGYEQDHRNEKVLLLLDHTIQADFDRAQYVSVAGNEMTLYYLPGKKSYVFQPAAILRVVNNRTDTVFGDVPYSYHITTVPGLPGADSLVKELALRITPAGDTIRLRMVKYYTAEQLLQYNN